MSAKPEALVLLNPAARGGRSRSLYEAVRAEIEACYLIQVVETDVHGHWRKAVEAALGRGIRVYIAAGGDGTVGTLAQELVRLGDGGAAHELRLGAVGLGSSNDFHKPVRRAAGNVPLCLDAAAARLRDVARARYQDEAGIERERLFLVSASLGVTAAGNALFNTPDRVLAVLKRRSTGAAIGWATLRSIAQHRNVRMRLRLPEAEHECELSNLSVLKTPHLSGGLRYDTPVATDDGRLAVNLCEGMGRLALIRMLLRLCRGCFLGPRGTRHWKPERVEVLPERPVALEIDGEVVYARRVAFDVLPRRLMVCAA